MKVLFLFMLAIAGSYHLQAQEGDDDTAGETAEVKPLLQTCRQNKYSLKMYNVTTLGGERRMDDWGVMRSEWFDKYLSPAAALNIRTKRGNQHEIELSNLNYSTKQTKVTPLGWPGGYYYEEHKTASVALRYEYILAFAKKKNTRVKPSLGFAGQLYLDIDNTIPIITSVMPRKYAEAGMRTFVVPRINIDITRRIIIDVNMPICLMDMKYTRVSVPVITLGSGSRAMDVYDVNTLPDYFSFRVGLGVRL